MPAQSSAQPLWKPAFFKELETQVLPGYLPECRWFAGKNRILRAINIQLVVELPGECRLCILEVQFEDGSEYYSLVLGLVEELPSNAEAIARLESRILVDGLHIPAVREWFWQQLQAPEPPVSSVGGTQESSIVPGSRILAAEQSNSSIIFGERWLFKLLRKVESGQHPEAEMLDNLKQFPNVPGFGGALQLSLNGQSNEWTTFGVMIALVPGAQDGWQYTLELLKNCFLDPQNIGDSLQWAELLGRRTAELHRALARATTPAFCPELVTPTDLKHWAASSSELRAETFVQLREARLFNESLETLEHFGIPDNPDFSKIRIHGDYHLGQVLRANNDVVIIDFEGEPRRPLVFRRSKRCALVDVAGMLRSFDYAAATALEFSGSKEAADRWVELCSKRFLDTYLAASENAVYLPGNYMRWLQWFLVEKATYEVGYELRYRPDFAQIPIGGLLKLALAIGPNLAH